MESVQKYLKITQEDFRKAYEISHRVQNSFSSVFGFTRLEKFCTGCEIHFSQSCSLSCSLYSSWAFCKGAKISHSHVKLLDVRFLLWFSSLHTWLIWQRLRSSPKLLLSLAYSLKIGNRRVICAYEHCYSMRSSDDSSTLGWNSWSWNCIDVDYWPHSSLVWMSLLHMGL